jgi:hypothetical protein
MLIIPDFARSLSSIVEHLFVFGVVGGIVVFFSVRKGGVVVRGGGAVVGAIDW